MSFIGNIRKHYDQPLINKCCEKKCCINLRGLHDHIIIKGETIAKSKFRICDCIIFINISGSELVLIELKSKTSKATEVEEKLKNGSEQALKILKRCDQTKGHFDIFHIVLVKSCRPSEFNLLKQSKINLNGIKYDIIIKRCGENILDILSKLE